MAKLSFTVGFRTAFRILQINSHSKGHGLSKLISSNPKNPGIDLALVEQLERLSLVELNNEAGLRLLQNAVKSVSKLHELNTDGVEPLITVLEDRELWMRSDEVTEGNCAEEILQNAAISEEQYFVAPPGNIALKKKNKDNLHKFLDSESSDTHL